MSSPLTSCLMSPRGRSALVGAWCLCAPGGVVAQPASFRGLGFIPNTEPASAALAVSASGSHAAGWCDLDAVRWSSDGGRALGRMASPFGGIAVAQAISGDGSVVVGFGRGEQVGTPFWAFAWDAVRGMVPLCPPPGEGSIFGSYASGVSADGRVIVGASDGIGGGHLRAFRAALDREWQPIMSEPSSASAVSGDGTVVVGIVHLQGVDRAFAWSEAAGMRLLDDLDGGIQSAIAYGVNTDGTWIVGGSSSGSSDPEYAYEAVLWSSTGKATALGDLPGGDYASEARGVSADGSVVVGLSTVAPSPRTAAFIWDATHGMRDLRRVLIDQYGLNLDGWELSSALGISADGRTIVGRGINPARQNEGWIAYLGNGCAGDWDGDGAVTYDDLASFLDAFFCENDGKSCRSADFDRDGVVDTRDFFAFLVVFFEGCER